MATTEQQILNSSRHISKQIQKLKADSPSERGFHSEGILDSLRNLVEGVATALTIGLDNFYDYEIIKPAIAEIGQGRKDEAKVFAFHKLLQISKSHYSMDEAAAERLMLKYFDYLIDVRSICKHRLNLTILENLEDFPLDQDEKLRAYHEAIAGRMSDFRSFQQQPRGTTGRFYIERTKPFLADGRRLYEVTFSNANDFSGKFDRRIAFTDIDLSSDYAVALETLQASIEVFGKTLPILLITNYGVSIRPCELTNFGKALGLGELPVQRANKDYQVLMEFLTRTGWNLLDIIDLGDPAFNKLLSYIAINAKTRSVVKIIQEARQKANKNSQFTGKNTLRYLLLHLPNKFIKRQLVEIGETPLGQTGLSRKCYPFERMPFAMSLSNHNVRSIDIARSISASGSGSDQLARKIRSLVESEGSIYIPEASLEGFEDWQILLEEYNEKLYSGHADQKIIRDKRHVFIKEYEDSLYASIRELKALTKKLDEGYAATANDFIRQYEFDNPGSSVDRKKMQALSNLFTKSAVALVYGAAGTGKTFFINLVAQLFQKSRILFLAHTKPAKQNLEKRVANSSNFTFATISSFVHSTRYATEYDLVVIDECSTVSNRDFRKVMDKVNSEKYLFVGDIYQIESIEFGNWFSVSREFVPKHSRLELTVPFRTQDKDLISLWTSVRKLDGTVLERLERGGHSLQLDSDFFEAHSVGDDEITLCLNYDGIFGINNINSFMQALNPSPPVEWNSSVYKVGDPILFNDSTLLGPIIYNNLRGVIKRVEVRQNAFAWFEVDIDKDPEEVESFFEKNPDGDVDHLGGNKIGFKVLSQGTNDYDHQDRASRVPFQIAYAVSIHKAQGLEYESVRVVITDEASERVSHSIFYTAITRTKKKLQIFWSPEVQRSVLEGFTNNRSKKDAGILSGRYPELRK